MKDSARKLRVIAIVAAVGCGGGGSYVATSLAPGGYDYAGEVTAAPTMAEQESGERYGGADENPFVDASQDALATFSLDVDTASYTIMRRDLLRGSLPAPEGVRVEEYLNFFDFDDAPPEPGDDTPFAVHLEAAPSPFGQGMHLLRVGVRGEDADQEQRPPANVVFLVDVSGSMQAADKLGLVKQSLGILLDSLRPDDTIGLVVYAGSDAVLLPPTRVAERGRILDAILSLTAGGSTNGAAGLRTAYDLAAQHFQRGGINRVILCTDGDFNVGVTGDELIEMIERQRERGITLSVLGFGSGNLNDRDMEQLADRGNGNYAYIDTRNEALRVLARDLAGTLQVIAKDVKVQVAFDREVVRRFRLIGYDNRVLAHRDFDDDSVDAAEIGSGDFVTALLEYELRPGVDPAQLARPLAEVRLRYKRPDGSESTLRTYPISASDAAPRFEAASESLRFAAAVTEYAEILRRSQHSEGARFADVIRIASEATGQSADRQELVELARTAQRLWAHHD